MDIIILHEFRTVNKILPRSFLKIFTLEKFIYILTKKKMIESEVVVLSMLRVSRE